MAGASAFENSDDDQVALVEYHDQYASGSSSDLDQRDDNSRRISMKAMTMRKGPWTAWEDERLLAYVREYGEGKWNCVAGATGLRRCGKSCRLRYKNHLRLGLLRGPFTPAEQRLIIAAHAKYGNQWAKIAAHLPGRTDNAVKNFWNTLQKRLRRQRRFVQPIFELSQAPMSGKVCIDFDTTSGYCGDISTDSFPLYDESSADGRLDDSMVGYEENDGRNNTNPKTNSIASSHDCTGIKSNSNRKGESIADDERPSFTYPSKGGPSYCFEQKQEAVGADGHDEYSDGAFYSEFISEIISSSPTMPDSASFVQALMQEIAGDGGLSFEQAIQSLGSLTTSEAVLPSVQISSNVSSIYNMHDDDDDDDDGAAMSEIMSPPWLMINATSLMDNSGLEYNNYSNLYKDLLEAIPFSNKMTVEANSNHDRYKLRSVMNMKNGQYSSTAEHSISGGGSTGSSSVDSSELEANEVSSRVCNIPAAEYYHSQATATVVKDCVSDMDITGDLINTIAVTSSYFAWSSMPSTYFPLTQSDSDEGF